MATLTPIITFLQEHVFETGVALAVLLVLATARFFLLYAGMINPTYGAARVLKVDGKTAAEVVRMLRIAEWDGAEVLEWRDEVSTAATPTDKGKGAARNRKAEPTPAARYASRIAMPTKSGKIAWKASVLDSEAGNRGTVFRWILSEEGSAASRRWLFSVSPVTSDSCIVTLGETGEAPKADRMYNELVWGGHFWAVDGFLRTWGKKIDAANGGEITVYAADKTPEDIRAALSWRGGDARKGKDE